MKKIRLFAVLIVIASCGGGGGGGAGGGSANDSGGGNNSGGFTITLGVSNISLDEDTIFNGSIAATSSSPSTLTYSLVSQPSNGSLQLNESNGEITYTPKTNFNGTDQFNYSVNSSENNVSKTGTINILVNSVNDPPSIVLLESNETYNYVSPDQNFVISVDVTDIDNNISDLTFSANSDFGNASVNYNSETNIATINPSNLNTGGPLDINLTVSDGVDSSSIMIKFWNLKKISNEQSINLAYTFLGNHSSGSRKINYVFFVDAFEDSEIIGIREGLREWLSFINDGDIDYFINNFFNFNIIELDPNETAIKIQTGTTLKEDYDFDSMTDEEVDEFYDGIYSEKGCSLRDPNMYCFNSDFVSDAVNFIQTFGINDIDNISVLTSTEGRGTACVSCNPPINIQDVYIGTNASQDVYIRVVMQTLKHEFGHTFNDLADEYRSDYWDPVKNPNGAINCRSVNDYYDDLIEYDTNQDGIIDEDENTEIERDGLIFDWPCYWVDGSPNTTSEDQPELFKWKHHFINPDNIPGYHDEETTEGLGIFTGTYYGIDHTSRPTYENIMGSVSRNNREEWWYYGNKTSGTSWDKIGIESFVIQALKYQGLHDLNYEFNNNGISISLNLVIPDDIFEIKWYVDGVLNESYNNDTSINIAKKSYGWQKIAYRISEKNNQSKYINARDELDTYADVYQGAFSSFGLAHYCAEPYSDEDGYDRSVCYGTVTAYDVGSNSTNSYGAYRVKNFDELMELYGGSENDHWMEYFVEYSGLGGQIGINWSNL